LLTATISNMDWLTSTSSPLSSPTLTTFEVDANNFSSPPMSPAFPSSDLQSGTQNTLSNSSRFQPQLSSNSYQFRQSYSSSPFGQTSSDSHLPGIFGQSGRHGLSPPPGWDSHSMVRDFSLFSSQYTETVSARHHPLSDQALLISQSMQATTLCCKVVTGLIPNYTAHTFGFNQRYRA
jgi:hypothetical protein